MKKAAWIYGHTEEVLGELVSRRRDQHLAKALACTLDWEGVSAAIVGPYTFEQAIQNLEFARQYHPLKETERKERLALGKELAPKLGPRYGAVA